jgi:hypothetical protein
MLVKIPFYSHARRSVSRYCPKEIKFYYDSGHLTHIDDYEINVNTICKVKPIQLGIDCYKTKTVYKYFWPFKFLGTKKVVNELHHQRYFEMYKIDFNDGTYVYTDDKGYQSIKTALNS